MGPALVLCPASLMQPSFALRRPGHTGMPEWQARRHADSQQHGFAIAEHSEVLAPQAFGDLRALPAAGALHFDDLPRRQLVLPAVRQRDREAGGVAD
jgi:hypothetical protein